MKHLLHCAARLPSSKKLCSVMFFLMISLSRLTAQTVINTGTTFTNDTTVNTVTFNFQNTNSYPVVITNIEGMLSDYGPVSTELWCKTSPINGLPGSFNTANGWSQISNANINGSPNTANTVVTQPLFYNISVTIPANTTYGFAVAASGNGHGVLRVGNTAPTVNVSNGGCNFLSGTNIGYSSNSATPAAATNPLKGWLGKITFISGAACTGTPNVPVISGPSSVCAASAFYLTATGYSVGADITYAWQYYNTSTLTWVDVGTSINYYSTGIGAGSQFRLKTTCGGNSSYSNTLTVNLGTGFAGNYTINRNAPSSATNFISFGAAIAAMSCGITGPVTFDVVPGSGPYTETANFASITGTSQVNKIRVNGHGETLQYYATSNVDLATVTIRHTNFLTIDSLTIKSLSQDLGVGVIFLDTVRNDSITHCFVDMRSLTTTSSADNPSGIMMNVYTVNNSNYYAITQNIYIGHNYVLGNNGLGGPYYGINAGNSYYNYGDDNAADTGNVIDGNTVENFVYGGIICQGSRQITVSNNDVHRTNRAPGSSFVGITVWGGDDYDQYDSLLSTIRVTGNRIHNPSIDDVNGSLMLGIEVGSSWYGGAYNEGNTDVLIANNAVYNMNTAASTVTYGIYYLGGDYGWYNDSSGHDVCKIYHNTIDFSQTVGSASNNNLPVRGIYNLNYYWNNNYADSNTVDIKNNLISLGTSPTLAAYGIDYGYYYGSVWTNISSERNNVYLNNANPNQFFCTIGGINYPTLAAFHVDYPASEVGSLAVDPQFTAAAVNGDLTPTNPLLFNNGVNLLADIAYDINGKLRSASPTPGAFEVGIDMGVNALTGPLGTFCSSVKMVSVSIKNFGLTSFTGAAINWSLNGVMQPTVNYTGTLAPNASAVVNLGNGLFMPSAPVTIKAWTSGVNGQLDANPLNDTLIITTQSSTSVPVNIGPDDSICTGTTLTLDAGFPGSQYVWDNSTYNQHRTIQNAGTYYVKVVAYDGCIGVDTMKLTLRPLPVVDLGPQQAICEGSTTTLDAGHPGAAYLWDNGTTNQTRTVDTAGQYEVAVTDVHGCTGVGDVTIIMKDLPSVQGINATHADSGLYTFYPLDPMYTNHYEWDFGDGSPHGIGYMVQHAYAHNGIYTVTLFLTGECTGLIIKNVRTVDVFSAPADNGNGTGINNAAIGGVINVYPNPTTDLLQIENKSQAKLNRVVVYNALGQMLINEKADNVNHHQLSTGGFANGIYSLRIETDKGTFVQKFEVMR